MFPHSGRNPLLLTVMTLVHTHEGGLPDARALLYEETADIFLWRWEKVKTVEDKSVPRLKELLEKAGRAEVDLKRLLWRLAYEVHEKTGEHSEVLADINEWELEKALADLHPKKSKDWADRVIKTIKMRAGLLLEREPEVYSFPHRTFQEYFAGAHLSIQTDFAKKACSLIEKGNFWREAVLLAVGRLIYLSGDSDKPLALTGELCPSDTGDNDTAWRKIWMAGEVLIEIGINRVNDSNLGRDLSGRVKQKITDLLRKGRLKPKERVDAGNVLGRLGDPRFKPDLFYLPDGKDLGFVKIPAGSFLMGTEKKDADKLIAEGLPDVWVNLEQPQHKVVLSEYAINHYPVTVAQFRVFVQDSGYETDGRWKNGQDNHPVVYVSWNDAVAYCTWLTEKLRQKGYNWQIKLPSEAQWEKAARGTDRRIYLWGNEPDPDKANCTDTGIGETSPVGCFPKGKSPYGILDMSGNVWEWCQDRFDDGYYADSPSDNPVGSGSGSDRVNRGGSWISRVASCRAALRIRFDPSFRYNHLGFRLLREAP
ncbi:MAG: SUMF1/EgtB/PvdO family nonheme iron enzyme [Desulfobacteraceae bacterium]|nr:SUMF1/EgtB/PvdO family nonheme iron enzyme [Desulfobacteraceae bacterium]